MSRIRAIVVSPSAATRRLLTDQLARDPQIDVVCALAHPDGLATQQALYPHVILLAGLTLPCDVDAAIAATSKIITLDDPTTQHWPTLIAALKNHSY